MVTRYRYSEWDGTQEIPPLAPDDILSALTDDLMNFGDLQQQLRQQRRQTLDRFNLSSAFDDIQKRLEEILEKERGTLDERLNDALNKDASGPEGDSGQDG